MVNICIFGDSITWGSWDPEGGGWVTRLRKSLELLYEKEDNINKELKICNLGISGDNTEDLLKRFKVECEAREPEKIIIAIGINDSQYVKSKKHTRVSLEDFRENIKKLIDLSKNFTHDIAFIGLTKVDESKTIPIPWNKDKEYKNSNIIEYDLVIKSLCKENNLKYVYLYDLLKNDDLYDGLHPNSEGHKKIFKKIMVLFK